MYTARYREFEHQSTNTANRNFAILKHLSADFFLPNFGFRSDRNKKRILASLIVRGRNRIDIKKIIKKQWELFFGLFSVV